MFPSMSHESAKDPHFQELSPAVQAAFRAFWEYTKALEDQFGDGEDPGPDADPQDPKIVAKRDAWAQQLGGLSENDQKAYSAFAHRCDYPEQYNG